MNLSGGTSTGYEHTNTVQDSQFNNMKSSYLNHDSTVYHSVSTWTKYVHKSYTYMCDSSYFAAFAALYGNNAHSDLHCVLPLATD